MELTEQLVEQIWQKEEFAENLREHCKTVEKASFELANKLIAKGIKVNLDFVKYGALLHDIGRARDHSVRHGLLGYEILQKYPEVPEEVRKIAKYHVGAGITKEEASLLRIEPAEDLLPITVEEKIVSYADNLVSGKKIRSYLETLKEFEKMFGKESIVVKRLQLEHDELENFATRDEMHKLEVAAIKKGSTVEGLMESAGREVAEITNKIFSVSDKKVVCFTGPGNNGGDAFVAARYFKKLFAKVLIIQLVTPQTWAAKINLKRAERDFIEIKEVKSPVDLKNIEGDIAIDGIFGTGVKGEIREPFAAAINIINKFKIKVAIDMPSGLNPDTGEEKTPTVNPDLVICLGRIKKGLIGKFPLGKVQIANIGI